MPTRPLVVASHNLMNGLGLGGLIPRYLSLRDAVGLGVLCVQENVHGPDGHHAARIASALGSGFEAVHSPRAPRLALVVDTARVEVVEHGAFALPLLAGLTLRERFYIAEGRPTQKYALLAVVKPRRGPPLSVVNFHLDTAGGNDHRADQVRAIADELVERGLHGRTVACGDTNAFIWRSRRQPALLDRLLHPLAKLGARDEATQPTHRFGRQREPKLSHRICVALGRIGIDFHQRYDVVCTNLSVERRGLVDTPESDHDLVWAALETGAAEVGSG